ncbi:MAG TPA: ATPase, T2SS/T4P/T4SS family [Acidimicrobiia bacterium]|nr:ATPase, T2SS/T4P/T4SS family [Acidimicrobiia bacterium]
MSGSAYFEIRRRTLEIVESQKIDAERQRQAVVTAASEAVAAYQRRAQLGEFRPLHDPETMVERIVRSVADFGVLTPLLERDDIEEIFIEGATVSFIDGSGRLRRVSEPSSEHETRQVIERLLSTTDRRLDAASPIVQGRVLGGTARLTAVIPPISDTVSATIRRYSLRKETLESLVELGSLSEPAAEFLRLVSGTTSSIVVSGQPGAGKTSLLSALLHAVPAEQCIRCCEEVRELHVPLVHGSYYEARPPGIDGTNEISLRQLVKVILAMRPDRIVVGEVRGAEAFELTRAVNAGTGFACTVHANSAAEALEALVNSALMAGENVAEGIVRRVFGSSIDLVVHLDRDGVREGDRPLRRRVMEVAAVSPANDGTFTVEPLFHRETLEDRLRWTGMRPPGRLLRAIRASFGPAALDHVLGREVA